VLYLVFNEGYTSTSGELLRTDLCSGGRPPGEALAELMPDEPEVIGLLALLLLVEARRPARVGPSGELVVLAEQDRSLWNGELIAEGHELVRRCLRRAQPGPYQVQAAINAVHTDGSATDWVQVLALYDQLLAHTPTPIVALTRGRRRRGARDRRWRWPPSMNWTCRAITAARHPADLLARLGRISDAVAPTTRQSPWPRTTRNEPSCRSDGRA